MYGFGTAGAAAHAAAKANAIKASGAIVRLEPKEFAEIVKRSEKPLVVVARAGWPSKGYNYLTPYRGLVFYTKVRESLIMPSDVELIVCDRIWIPG
jgi:hypothetical protein